MKYPKCFDEVGDILDDVLEGPLKHQSIPDFHRRMAIARHEVLKIQIRLVGDLESRPFRVGDTVVITEPDYKDEVGVLTRRANEFDWEVKLPCLPRGLFNEDEMELI